MAAGSATISAQERPLLAAARQGDEDAFRRLVDPYRGELHAHCYRMLGSVHDAEDALQDAMLRAWRALAKFEGRSSLRSWLYTIATNTSLNLIGRRPKRVLPIDYAPAADPHGGPGLPVAESVWMEPYADEKFGLQDGLAGPEARFEQRESVELAFIAALQHLPANQRAVLILRDVLGFSAKETAETLETSVASANSALQRARATVEERLPDQSQQATLRALGDDALGEIVDAFVAAWERGDIDAVAAMLAQEAIIAMPPMPTWYHGRDAVVGFLRRSPLAPGMRWRVIPARASGQVAFGFYLWRDEARAFTAHDIIVLTMDGARIAELIAFLEPETFRHFGLPGEWSASALADGRRG
jgi:RNA polymerase sigma-70 factor, ECF subfamily